MEVTDTEKQFSWSSKQTFDLPVEKQFSATQSPEEPVSPLKEITEISPVNETLDINDLTVSVGRSPSDFHFDPELEHKVVKHESSVDEGFSSKHGTLDDSTENKDFGSEAGSEVEKAADTTGDSLLEDETITRQFTQTEIIKTKEEIKEQKVASSESKIQELTISKDTSGPVPQLIVEQKTYTTHDEDSYSKLTVSEEESVLKTKETITEELDFDDEGMERKKEKKELVSSLQHKSDLKEDEVETKTSAKREDLKETIYPFGRDSSPEKHLLDTVGSKEEILETTVRSVTESGTCTDDTAKQKVSREYKISGDTEEFVPDTEEIEEDRTVSKQTIVVETGDLKADLTKHDAIREVLFDIEKDEKSGKPTIEPAAERFGEQSEHLTMEETFHSKETDKQEFKESKGGAKEKEEGLNLEGYEYYHGGHRDSGHFEEESSDEESEDDEVDRTEHLKSMAFDNMGFEGAEGAAEDVKQKTYYSQEGAGYLSPTPGPSHHIPLSPDDMEERHTRFDFAEELKQEMYDSGHFTKDPEEDKTLSLSEADMKSFQMAGTPAEITEIPDDEGDKFIGEGKVIQETDDIATEGAVGPAIAIEIESLDHLNDESSSSSESPCENELFDRYTGNQVPWEIASQYRRQFSDSFVEQEHLKESSSTKSLDMGEFFRRDSDNDGDITFLDEQKKGSSSSSDEVSPTTRKKMQKVRFSLSEDHHFETDTFSDILDESMHVHSYDLKMNEEWLKSGEPTSVDQIDDISLLKSEPHDKITNVYHQAVLASIESRLQSELNKMKALDNFEDIQGTGPEIIPTTSVKITSADATESVSRDKFETTDYENEYSKDSDIEDLEVNSVFTASGASKPLSVVSRESRLAHEELLRESFDEKDRSVSPSIDSEELSTTYESQKELQEELDLSLLADKSFPVCQLEESSETDRDTVEEERLSPIEETSGGEATEVTTLEIDGEKHSDKKVTFQTDMQHLCSVSSEELVKTSTSSSEVEPTLLAASYDLDSGRVSHVVTAYDLSPDTVEKQFLPVGTTSKAILSSPEDDVFEADVTVGSVIDSVIGASGENEETPTEGDIELLPRDSPERMPLPQSCEFGSTSSGTIPSPPAPSPFEVQRSKDTTATDLEVAALKIQKLQTSNSAEKADFTLELSGAAVTQASAKVNTTDLFEDESSPFEMMSPSDLEGYEDWCQTQEQVAMPGLDESQSSTSSFVEIEKGNIDMQQSSFPAPVVPTAPPIPTLLSPDESTKDSSFDHSSPVSSEPSEKGLESPLDNQQPTAVSHIPDIIPTVFPPALPADAHRTDRTELVLPNGPTEVEYNPEIDLDFSGSHPQEHLDGGGNGLEMFVLVSQSDSNYTTASVEPAVNGNEPSATAVGTQQTELTESVIEELHVQAEGDVLIVSDQTLYGLEMPSDEAASLTTSHVDSGGRVEESDSLNVSVITSMHDDTSEQIDSREALGQIMGIDKTDEDISERPSELQEMEESPVTHSSKHTFDSETLHDDSVVPLSLSDQEPFTDEGEVILGKEMETQEKASSNIEVTDTKDSEAMGTEAVPSPVVVEPCPNKDTHDMQYRECKVEYNVEEEQEEEEEEAFGGDDRYTPDEPKGTDDELDEELIVLKENSDYDIDTKLEEFGVERAIESAGSISDNFELKADSCDLDRPLTPTPVDKKQGFFDDKFELDLENKAIKTRDYEEIISSYPKNSQENLIEQTACKFVETVLEEVKYKVKSKATLELDEDMAIIQSPSSETGGDFTEIPDELPFDEPGLDVVTVENMGPDKRFTEQDIQKPVHLTKSSKPLVLVKQFSEEIPEVTLSQHLSGSSEEENEEIEKVEITEQTFQPVLARDLADAGSSQCVPELEDEIAVEDTIVPSVQADVSALSNEKAQTDYGKVCVPESADDDDIDGAVLEPVIETNVALKYSQPPLCKVPVLESDTLIKKSGAEYSEDFDEVSNASVEIDTDFKQCLPPLPEFEIVEVDTLQKKVPDSKSFTEDYEIDEMLSESLNFDLKQCPPPLPQFQTVEFDTFEKKPPDAKYPAELLPVTVKDDGQQLSSEAASGTQASKQSFLVKGSDFGYLSEKENEETMFNQTDKEPKSEQKLEFPYTEQSDKETGSEDHEIFLDAQSSCEIEKKYHVAPEVSERKLSKTGSEEEEKSEEFNKGYQSSDFDDTGDSSSVDSFTTVVAADEEEDEDEDRLADFASLTSSIHSDIQGGESVEDIEKEPIKDPLEELIAWAKDKQAQEIFQRQDSLEDKEILQHEEKTSEVLDIKGIIPFPWIKDEEDNESLEGSDRYDYVDRTALSVITELSEEDRFEIIEKDELESESTGTGSDSRHYSSPDFPPPSPMSSLKFFSKSGDKDDISVSSSLLEFERLEREISESGSKSSNENIERSSLAGSLDDSKFLSKSLEKDDISVSSSLADFERLERECNHGSSDSSIEKILSPSVISPPETGKSSISGSVTSLSEFERLEKECLLNEEARRSSVESSGQKSVTSSQASLNEFERLEQELFIAEKLEAEAQKIVSILESGSLLPNQYGSEPELSHSESLATTREILLIKDSIPKMKDDIDKDSFDGKDDLEDDSLSENKKKTRGDVPDDTDSLDGDQSEMTTSVNSMILTCESQTKFGQEYDVDSLHDSSEGAMKISSDSLGERLSGPRSDKEKSESDSLLDHEGVMDKSADSLELNQEPISESPERVDSDSLGQDDALQSSTDSLESYQIDAKHTAMEVSTESTGWSSASSMFSRSSLDTMKSAERDIKSDSGHSKDVMEASIESWDEYADDEEETDNFYIISKYQTSLKQAAESSKLSSEKTAFIDPYLDYEGNVAMDNYNFTSASNIPWDTNFQNLEKSKKSPYLSKGRYEEPKKIWSMTEWEAMKKAKKLEQEEKEKSEADSKQTEAGIDTKIVKSDRTVTQVVNTSTKEIHKTTKTTETVSKSGETDKLVEKDSIIAKTEDSQPAKLSETLGPDSLTRELPIKPDIQGILQGGSCCLLGCRYAVTIFMIWAASSKKSVFEHAQNAQIQIIMCMYKVSSLHSYIL